MSEKIYDSDTDVRVGKLWDDYQTGLRYQSSLGLSRKIPQCVRFYEGDQWPKVTERTKSLPRPVINIIKLICRNKKSAILSKRLRLVFEAESALVNTRRFNEYAAYIMKEMGAERLDKLAIDDAVKKGTYVYHYYWDAEARGKDALQVGGLRCEIIEPLNIFFSNPTERDEQKQKWIIIVSREDVSSVRAKADEDVDRDSIVSDECEDRYGTVEQESDRLCTVLTRYFRQGGEVYCERATKSVMINKPFAIAPDVKAAREYLGFDDEADEELADAPNNSLPDKDGEGAVLPKGAKAPLYPIVVGSYEPREKSIFGIGEVEGLIANQKSINFHFAMSLLSVQELAWGKYIVMPGALKGQTITNEPAQVLTDYTGTGNGIKKLAEQPLHGEPTKLAEELIQLTRNVSGASEVMSGEVVSASMSGAAIAQLQAQASQPIEELADSFRLVKEKQGQVIAQFMKLYYFDRSFTYEEDVPQEMVGLNIPPTEIPEQMPGQIMQGVPTGQMRGDKIRVQDSFSSSEYEDVDFDVIAEAVSGTKSSAAGDIQLIDSLYSQGKISARTYIMLYPDDAISNKSEILRTLESEEQSSVQALSAQIEQMTAEAQRMSAVIAEQEATVSKVESVINENARLRSLLIKVYSEAKTKIAGANMQIGEVSAAAAEATEDATLFAQEIARRDAAKSQSFGNL